MPDQREVEVAPWPAWVRYGLLTLLAAVIGTGLVIALYQYGWLKITGPFVVLVLVPFIFFLRALWLRHRLLTASRRAADAVRVAIAAVAAERGQAAQVVAEQLDATLQRLAWGQDAAAANTRAALADSIATWPPENAATQAVGSAVRALDQLAGTLGRADQEIDRRNRR